MTGTRNIADKPALPSSLDAEKGVISSILLDPSLLESVGVKAEHFHHPSHQLIFRSLVEMHDEKKPIDLVTLTQKIADQNQLEQIGGSSFLAELQTFLPTAKNVEFYAGTVIEKASRRAIIAHCAEITRRAYEDNADKPEAILDEASSRIDEISQSFGLSNRGDLISCRFDPLNPPTPALPRLFLADQGICTAGNLSVLTGQAKAGKSAVAEGILASMMNGRPHLGFQIGKQTSGAVIHLDTEQSPFHHHRLIHRAMDRAGVKDAPEALHSFRTAHLSHEKRKLLLLQAMAEGCKAWGCIRMVIIDGVADLCYDLNDPIESFTLVQDLQSLAVKYDCPILMVLHLNPSSDFKTRGHLGSQLERKAESVIALENKNNIVTAWIARGRDSYLPKNQGQRFGWNEQNHRFESIQGTLGEMKSALKEQEEKAKWKAFADSFFTDKPLSYKACIEGIEQRSGVSKRTAQRHMQAMTDYAVIEKNAVGEYWLAVMES